MKYIITKSHGAVIFTEAESHRDIAEACGGAQAAGFVTIRESDQEEDGIEVACFGESISTGLKSRHEEDEAMPKEKSEIPEDPAEAT